MRESSDAELLRDSLVQPDRFERIFDRHYDVVRRYAHRRVGKEAGEDVAADTFLTAFSIRSSFDGRSESARAWLFGIANNLVRHHLRAEWTRAAAWSRLPLETAEFDHVDAEKLDALRAAPAIAAAFQTLNPDDRETFLLFALGELTYDEVADALAIPTGTVRSRIFRVRKILREQLSDVAAIKGSDSESPSITEGQV